ncbi:MAG: DinB family protein [Gemmatimonas sp.]
MKRIFASLVLPIFFVLAALPAGRVSAQTAPVVTDLMKDIDGVAQKLVAMAKAMPVEKYSWRPGAGVRSVGEVFLHVASDNYLLPALGGTAMPASTKLDAKNFKTFETYEKRTLTREQIVAELETSFAHLKTAMQKVTAAQLPAAVDMFGQKSTQQALWIATATHLHEHLGQSIAYARTNGIVPPWSK